MHLTWHIIAKDLRQDKWALGSWLLLFAAHLWVGSAFLNTDGSDLEWIDQLRWGNLLLTIFEFVMGYLLALRWVQADDVSGTRMFWVTRPISGGRLFAAKLAGLLLVFGLVPVALWLPWWVSSGLGARELGWMSVQAFGWQLALIAPALLIGSITDDFGRGIMWSLILVVVALGWAVTGQSGLTAPGATPLRPFMGLWLSRVCVAVLLLVTGFLGIAAVQYFTRHTWRALVRVGVLALLVGLVGRWWLVDFSPRIAAWGESLPSTPGPAVAENLRFSPTEARFSPFTYKQRGPDGRPEDVHSMTIDIDVAGLAEDLGLLGDYQSQALVWRDRPALNSSLRRRAALIRMGNFFQRALALPAMKGDPETIQWHRARLQKVNAKRAAEGLAALEDWWDRPVIEPAILMASVSVPESALPHLRAQAPAYVARLDGRLVRPEVTQRLPLRPGARGSGSLRTLRVISVNDQIVKLAETMPAYFNHGLFFTRNGPLATLAARNRSNDLWSVNRHTGDLESASRRRLVESAVSVGGIALTWSETRVSPPRWIRNNEWVIKDPAWIANTDLVVVSYPTVELFTRDIRGDNLNVHFQPPKVGGTGRPPADD